MTKTANQQLVDYIEKTISQGYTEEQLRKSLIDYGYQAADVDEAFDEAVLPTSVTFSHSEPETPESAPAGSPAARPEGIKHRNPLLVLMFSLITFGIYAIYWYVVTTKELRKNTSFAPNPWLILLSFVPIACIPFMFYYDWKYSRAINELTGYDTMTLFIIWVFLPPAAMYISQTELNTKAEN